MSLGDVYLTREGFDKLKDELDHLKRIKRKEISKAIKRAREFGDISENAEYDAAKDAQAQNERKIAELEFKLSQARIIDDEDIPKDEVRIGATVSLKDSESGEELQYTLTSELEADFSQNKISIGSPIGRGLLGHKAGDEVEIQVPAGILKYKILKITR